MRFRPVWGGTIRELLLDEHGEDDGVVFGERPVEKKWMKVYQLKKTKQKTLISHFMLNSCVMCFSVREHVWTRASLPVGELLRLLVDRRPLRVRKRSLTILACSSSSRFFWRSSSESCSSGSWSFSRSIMLPVLSEKHKCTHFHTLRSNLYYLTYMMHSKMQQLSHIKCLFYATL